ncbi:probable flagellar motor switch protein [Fulvimarina pelagi HTCC2506]|uniref:Flagellar motor switch protein FliG n=1 Tax=Fulvimarina pelagi HTCC2506 TaxID=314231 RepID=Q0G103_9HYPH|nr:FliG C-terminal domain-containing protein [Fulvimarina pelagi]EAU40836.1 probable flagellar motor switch protein [Fulvimarina pelagi HTCC2506]
MNSLASYSEELHAAPLRGGARAAVLLLALGPEGASRLLKHMAPDEIVSLKAAAAKLENVSPDQIDEVVEDFASTFKRGPIFPGPGQQMADLLRNALSENEYEALFPDEKSRAIQTMLAQDKRNVWEAVADIEGEVLAKKLSGEHPHIIAILLSKVPSDAAVLIVRAFEPDLRNDVLKRMLQIKPLAGPIQSLFESHVRQTYLVTGDDQAGEGRHTILANVVNRLAKDESTELIDFIEVDQPEEAMELRKLLFAFEDIPGMPQKARLTLFDGIGAETIILALQGAPDDIRESILSAQGARARRMIEAELSQESNATKDAIEAARRDIAGRALELAGEGTIILRESEDED